LLENSANNEGITFNPRKQEQQWTQRKDP